MEKRQADLPSCVANWFASRGWQARPHQLEMLAAARRGAHTLLVAPTGAGKTLAGFLPTLAALIENPADGLHTIYVSPLKALAVDVARNLEIPVAEMKLPVRIETRTGDTPSQKKQRQRVDPPHILLTTPESLSLLMTYAGSATMLATVRAVVIDEIHAFAPSKRGDLLSLALARLDRLADQPVRRVGLSATVADEPAHQAWLAPGGRADAVTLVRGAAGAPPTLQILIPEDRIPWAGHAARHALPGVYDLIRQHKTSLIFVNTRGIAERTFQDLWAMNADNLPIALHHGSLSAEQRRKVEAGMSAGKLRAIVATASLDLGIDWGDVDLVVQLGAPKGASRLLQRIGRANHRLDEPSKAVLVPGNRFEYLETMAACDAVMEHALDGDSFRDGSLDVLAQHVMGVGCAAPFAPDDLFAEIVSATPYAALTRDNFQTVLDFVATGGYALRAYDKFRKLRQDADGLYRVSHPRLMAQHRLNAGTIVETPMLNVRLGRSPLGKIEEWFAEQLSPGDSFVFAGQLLELVKLESTDVVTRRSRSTTPKVPNYMGGRLPLSTHLADRVRKFLSTPESWQRFPGEVRDWLEMQQKFSVLPDPAGLLVETFPRNGRWYTVAYCFEGRNAHQSLGLLMTRRMENLGLDPMGFVGNDYAVSIWSLKPVDDPAPLFVPDILEEELKLWMQESSVLRRSFREVAIISGLIERQQPGLKKTGRQLMASTDLVYDVLRKYDPGHMLLRATWEDARRKVTDVARLDHFLQRIQGRIDHKRLDHVSPLAVPVMLEIGKEMVFGRADETLLDDAAGLVSEATAGL
jgi:ATP-dependent helicase Lhr and Lhr-like helicase